MNFAKNVPTNLYGAYLLTLITACIIVNLIILYPGGILRQIFYSTSFVKQSVTNKLALMHGTEKSYTNYNGWMGTWKNKIK